MKRSVRIGTICLIVIGYQPLLGIITSGVYYLQSQRLLWYLVPRTPNAMPCCFVVSCCTVSCYSTPSQRLQNLGLRRRWKLRAKYPIPEATRDAEAVLIIHEVVLKMVLLEFLVERWQPKTLLVNVVDEYKMF